MIIPIVTSQEVRLSNIQMDILLLPVMDVINMQLYNCLLISNETMTIVCI